MSDPDKKAKKLADLQALAAGAEDRVRLQPERQAFASSLSKRLDEDSVSTEVNEFLVANVGKIYVDWDLLDARDNEAFNNKISHLVEFDTAREAPLKPEEKQFLLMLFGQKN